MILFALAGFWKAMLLYWVLPGATILALILRIRGIAEHIAAPNQHELNATRSVQANFLERLLIAPLNVNLHLEHHLFPAVPFYHLPKLQELLLQQPVYRGQAHLVAGYLSPRHGILREVLRRFPESHPEY